MKTVKAGDVFIFVARNEDQQCGYIQGGRQRRYMIPVIISAGIPKKDWTYMPAEIGEEFEATDGSVFILTDNLNWQFELAR